MTIAASLLPEYDQEMAGTRKTLERIPEDKLDWKAHPKSNTIGWVSCHLAEIPGYVEGTMQQDFFDIHPPGGEPYQTPIFKTRREILEAFDRNVAAGRKALAAAPDADFGKAWSLKAGGQDLITMTKGEVIRGFVLSHMIHHRAHLCVYLRLNGVPVPALYGPSGDEE